MGSCDKDHGFAVVGSELIIFGQTAELGEPAEGPFDDPSLWQYGEAVPVGVAAFDDLQLQTAAGKQLPVSFPPIFRPPLG